jgi:DNA (cytosine-5)-methyltransferase 1
MKQLEDEFTRELPLDVTGCGEAMPAHSQLVLSLFPGIDLLGRGFQEEGFCVVRGPDLIQGGDVRRFFSVSGRFDGIIGGPPCPDFSRARRGEPTGYGLEMIEEFKRIVRESRPSWWLMENVPGVPDVRIEGYGHQRIDLNATQCGLKQNRLRHFQFGHNRKWVIAVERSEVESEVEPCCLASEGRRPGRRTWADFCRLQGLPSDYRLDQYTQSARYRAVGNGVPVPMARVMARAVAGVCAPGWVRLCVCGCGRPVEGRAVMATPACRKRLERLRKKASRRMSDSDRPGRGECDSPGMDEARSVTAISNSVASMLQV